MTNPADNWDRGHHDGPVPAAPPIKAIETRYADCRFRSRLEARWAVFFDAARIAWEYESEGFQLPSGRRYLPDFLLPDCGTWIEVKGHEGSIDRDALCEAAHELPEVHNGRGEHGPRLLVLGPIPAPPSEGDWGWLEPGTGDRWGFGAFHKNRRPWQLSCGEWSTFDPDCWHEWDTRSETWTEPMLDPTEQSIPHAYRAARSARFEHGEVG